MSTNHSNAHACHVQDTYAHRPLYQVNQANYLQILWVSQRHGSNSKPLGLYIWWRWLGDIQSEHQKGGRKWNWSDFEHGVDVGARLIGLEYFKNYWSTAEDISISQDNRKWSKKGEISNKGELCRQEGLADVRGEWLDWFEIIERQQELK